MSVLVPQTPEELAAEAIQAEELLRDRVVVNVNRHRPKELCVVFTDGTRLLVDWQENGLELSITGAE